MVSKKTLNTLLASAVALTVAGGIGAAQAEDHEAATEKCYGVVKAGHNDCGNAAKTQSCSGQTNCASSAKTHSCAGHAATDGDSSEWIALPAGVCDKLVGGSLEPVAAADDHAEEHGDESAH